MKKTLILFLTIMIIGITTSCNKSNNNKIDVAPLREVEVKILLPGDDNPPGYDDVIKAINDKLKEDGKPYTVKFYFLSETEYHQMLPLRINDKYDAAWIHIDNLSYYISQGVLRNVKPYLEKYGEVLLEHTPDYAWKQVTVNGKIYAIPRNAPVSDSRTTLAVRKDWMDEFGMAEINTIEDLERYFAEVYKKVSESPTQFDYVYTADNHYEFLYREYAPSFFFPLVNYAARPIYIDVANKENGKYVVKNFYQSEEFIALIEKTRTYYTPLNYVPDTTPSNTAQLFYGGMLGAVWNTILKTSERIDEFKAYQPNGDIYDVYLNKEAPRYITVGTDNMIGLLSKGENPNETVDFFNWVRTSQENHDLVCYGIEGINYNLTENGRLDFTNIRKDKRYSDKMPYWSFNDFRFVRWSKNLSQEYIDSRLTWDTSPNVVVTDLVGFMVDLSDTRAATLYANIKATESAPATHLIDGRWDYLEILDNGKTRYEQFIEDLEKAGIDEFIQIVQKQLDDFLGQ